MTSVTTSATSSGITKVTTCSDRRSLQVSTLLVTTTSYSSRTTSATRSYHYYLPPAVTTSDHQWSLLVTPSDLLVALRATSGYTRGHQQDYQQRLLVATSVTTSYLQQLPCSPAGYMQTLLVATGGNYYQLQTLVVSTCGHQYLLLGTASAQQYRLVVTGSYNQGLHLGTTTSSYSGTHYCYLQAPAGPICITCKSLCNYSCKYSTSLLLNCSSTVLTST